METNTRVRLGVDCTEAYRRKVKALASMLGVPYQELVISALGKTYTELREASRAELKLNK